MSVDEQMMPYKGAHQLKRYNPNKPRKRGFLIWVAAGAKSGYVHRLEVSGVEPWKDKEIDKKFILFFLFYLFRKPKKIKNARISKTCFLIKLQKFYSKTCSFSKIKKLLHIFFHSPIFFFFFLIKLLK